MTKEEKKKGRKLSIIASYMTHGILDNQRHHRTTCSVYTNTKIILKFLNGSLLIVYFLMWQLIN